MKRAPRIARYRHLVLAAVIALGGCGFHPRGASPLPAIMEHTYIDFAQPYDELSRAVRAELSAGGAEIVDKKEHASAVLSMSDHRVDQRVLSVGRSAKATEYEMFEEISFSLKDAKGTVLLEPQKLRTTRDYVFDETQLLGKVEESEELRQDMRQSLARQMLDRIRAGLAAKEEKR